jgi:protoheme IX farnesyltransferase
MTSSRTSAVGLKAVARPTFLAAVCAATSDFWALTKPEVNFLILIATFTGFYLGYPSDLHPFPFALLLNALGGTLLVASGTGTLNQYFEYHFDAQMRRTCRRPIAAGRLRPATAAWFGVSLSVLGAAYLFLAVNALTGVLAVLTLTSYLFIYTPLKRQTPLCTLAGAFSGAMPPLIGWAAASGSISNGKAWILYAVLFLWQFPHFMAIAWMYRQDYARAGYLIFPTKREDNFLTWVTSVPSVALFMAGLGAVGANSGGIFQYSAAVILGSGLLFYAMRQVFLRSRFAARQLLKATIVYLPLEFMILVLGKG